MTIASPEPEFAAPDAAARPLWLVPQGDDGPLWPEGVETGFAAASGFAARPGQLCLLPGPDGVGGALFGIGKPATPADRPARERFTLARAAEALPAGAWRIEGAPAGTQIGHVHLQVGAMDAADDFMQGTLGLTRTHDAPGGGWYGWNGYHHHLAANVWNSRGAGPRPDGRTGLDHVALTGFPGKSAAVADPFGNRFEFV